MEGVSPLVDPGKIQLRHQALRKIRVQEVTLD